MYFASVLPHLLSDPVTIAHSQSNCSAEMGFRCFLGSAASQHNVLVTYTIPVRTVNRPRECRGAPSDLVLPAPPAHLPPELLSLESPLKPLQVYSMYSTICPKASAPPPHLSTRTRGRDRQMGWIF